MDEILINIKMHFSDELGGGIFLRENWKNLGRHTPDKSGKV